MPRSNSIIAIALLIGGVLLGADTKVPAELKGVDVTEKLGEAIDQSLEFVDESGYPKPLSQYFKSGRPVLLNLVYYTCPMLCNLVLNHQTEALRGFEWTPGEQFEMVTVSIDPTENFGMAKQKRAHYVAKYDRPAPGWHFLVDYQGNAKRLAQQVGFGYRFDEKAQQYAHPAVAIILTPQGKVSRYIYGLMKPEKVRDLKLAFVEAASERYGLSERVLLWCFHYDPEARGFVPHAKNIMKAGGALGALVGFGFLYRLWTRERQRGYQSAMAAGEAGQLG